MSGGGRGSSSPIPGTHGANLQRMLSYEEEPSCGDATPPHAAGNMNNVSASGAGNKSSTTPNRVTALNTLAASPRNMIVRPLKSILRNWKPSGPSVSSSEKDGDTTTAAGANRRVYIEGGSRSPEAASTPDVISGTRFLHGGQGPRNPEPGGAMSMRNSNGVDLRREEQEEHLQARLGGGQIFRRAGSTSTFTSDDIRNMSIGDRNPFPSPRHTVLPSMGETPQTSGPLGHFLHPAQPVTSTAGGPVANIEGANTNKVTPSNLNGGRTTSTTSASGGAGEHSKQHQQQHSTAASTPGGLAGGGSQHHSQQHYLLAPLNSPKQEDEGLCLDASVRSPSRMRTGSTGSDISASGSKQERPAALAETTTAATPSPTRAFFNKAATSQTSVMNDNRYAGSGAGRESGRSGDDRFRNGDTTPHLCVGAQTPSNAGYLSTKHAKEVLRGTLTPLFHKNHVKEKRDTVVREAEQLRLALRKQYVINPDESAMATVIQSVSAFCLFIVCFLTPYEVAFLDMRIGSTVFWLNRLIDVSFTADMILQFFLLYRVNTLAGERLLVVSQTQIAAHYLRTWFLVDFLAVFPFWAFEIWGMTNAASAGEGIGLLRVLRLLKLGKVIKSLRMLRERAIHIEITYYRGQLITFIFVLILAAHWMACAWGAAGLRFGGPFYYNPNLEDVVLNNVYENYEWSKTWVGRESGLANSTASSSSGARQLSSAHENMSAPAATSASKLDASTLSPSAQGTSGRDVGRAFFETLNGSGFLDTARASEEKLLQDRAAELEFAGIGKGSWSVSRPVLEDEREDGTLNRHPGEDSGLSRNARENKNLQVQHADFFVTLAVSPWRYVGWHLLRNPFGVQAWGATKLVGDSVLLGDGTAIRKRILQMQPGEQKIHDVMGEAAGTLMWSGHTRTTIEDINNKLDHDPNPQKIRRPDVSSRRRGSALWEYITANAPLSLADYISLSTSPERQRITSGIRRGLSMKSVGEVHLVDLLGGSRAIIDNNRVSSSDTSEQRRQLISGIPEPGFTTDSLWAGRRRLSWMQVYCGCVKCRTAKMCKQCNVCLESPWQIYVGSLHFSLMTLTSIGYGDISATHTAERFTSCSMMFVAGVLWASIVGFACGLISNHTAQERKYSQTIDDLNSMMRDKNVSENMRGRLRQFFFNQQKDVDSQELYQKLLVRMSPTLQAEVAFAAYAAFMLRVPFLADAELEFLAAICLACKHVTFGQGEPIGDTQVLYIIRAGVCFINGNVYRIGSSFGEDVLLDDADLAGFYSGFALTFVEASTITRKQLNDVLFKHPEQSVKIRRHKVTLAVRKTLLHLARQRSREKYGRETAGVSIPSLRSMSSSLSDPMLWRAEAEIMHANRREHAVNRDALERSLKRFHFAKRTADERLEPVSKLIVEDMLQRNSDTVLRETAQFMEHTCDSAGITLKMSVDETDDDMVAEMN